MYRITKRNQMVFKYGIDQLTVSKVIAIAKGNLNAVLTEAAIEKVIALTTAQQTSNNTFN